MVSPRSLYHSKPRRRGFLCLLVAVVGCATEPAPSRLGSDAGSHDAGQLPCGVDLSAASSIDLSFAASRASYLPAGAGCSAEYFAILSADDRSVRTIEITFGDSVLLDEDYELKHCDTCAPQLPNFLSDDGGGIQVNVNGIEGSGADKVSSGAVRFRSLTGNLEFAFSFTFSDGKVLQGTFNLPVKEDMTCPGPS